MNRTEETMSTNDIDWCANRKVVIPAGTYFLCDPCYVVADDEWDDILNKSNYLNQLYAEHDRGVICSFSTAYGDGSYPDQYGNRYDVDAGCIALTDIRYNPELAASTANPHRTVTFTEQVTCYTDDNCRTLHFGDTVIDTAGSWEDEE